MAKGRAANQCPEFDQTDSLNDYEHSEHQQPKGKENNKRFINPSKQIVNTKSSVSYLPKLGLFYTT